MHPGFRGVRQFLAAALCCALVMGIARAEDVPAMPLDERINQLIGQLGHDDYFVRERAQQELAKIGFEAFDTLEAAEDNDDIEVASRAKYLVSQMQIEWTAPSDPPEVKRLLQNYGLKDEAAHLVTVSQLVNLTDDRGLPVLCRLVRFDKSLVLSKLAALSIIEQKRITEKRWPGREQAIRDNLGRSPRPGAEWLRAYLTAHKDPAAAVDSWGRLAEAEQRALSQPPQQTQPVIVCALWRQQVAVLRKLDRRDEAVAAMMRIVDLEEGHSETLVELVNWLVEQEAWSVVDTVAKRFGDRIQREPILLYTLAQAQQAQGNEKEAQQTADRARALNEGTAFDNLLQHYEAARELQRRGMHKWCQQEYRHVIQADKNGEFITFYAWLSLSELLHDQGDDLAAAQVWGDAVRIREAKEQKKEGDVQDLLNKFGPLETMRARLHFFRACQHEASGERAEQLAELKAGLDDDPAEVDVLIALYRYQGLDDELKDKTRRLIGEAAEGFRREIQEEPEDSKPYNQLAWLLANTGGDADEARRASERSLELLRSQSDDKDIRLSEAGYLDTLARCRYAQGDLEGAFEVQSKAVEQDPHSGQMGKQWKFFKEELAKTQQKSS